ncbi:AraC family transcriptional regulator N-terminal domain-containing protein [Paenibacillus sp. NPDC056722]|uniref:AraC family transcriptional regulator n=1 Tax=Paenibacillus sp. NPDC056722 TaxID=3345924 RepID=UPI003679B4E9
MESLNGRKMKSDNISSDIYTIYEQLTEKLLRLLPEPQKADTALDGLVLLRRDVPTQDESNIYRPVIGLIVQGRKRTIFGNGEMEYGEGEFMVSGVDMPCINSEIEASPQAPFLSLSLPLDLSQIAQLATEVPLDGKVDTNDHWGICSATSTLEIAGCFLRLISLLENPERIPILAPLIIREIHYHLIIGPLGGCLRAIGTQGTPINRVAQAITWLRNHFQEPLLIENLANQVHMSESTFNRHFRKVTSYSPLRFQKRLRLYEAQRLMLFDNLDATTASFKVGYESPTQFSREYKREFGEPPHRDISRMRAAGMLLD